MDAGSKPAGFEYRAAASGNPIIGSDPENAVQLERNGTPGELFSRSGEIPPEFEEPLGETPME
jgi:hypothetical protein